MRSRPPRPAEPIDWRKVHEFLDRGAEALRDDAPVDSRRTQAILDERARLLARVPVCPPDASEMIEVVTFALGGECLALETRYVRRVLRRWECTPIADAPEQLVGVANLHGEVLALFDPRVLFGMPPAEAAVPARLLVLGEDRDELGLLADAVGDVRPLRIAGILPPPASFEGPGRSLVRGGDRGRRARRRRPRASG